MIIFSRKTHGCWVPPFLPAVSGQVEGLPALELQVQHSEDPLKTLEISFDEISQSDKMGGL